MKKYVLLVLFAIFAMSCSKKINVTGKITGGSPLERIELIEASGVATLPLTNIGISPTGEFSSSFEAPKSGMYLLSYAGKQNLFYIKQGQTFQISGKGADFPQEYVITGDAKNNNEFLKMCQIYFEKYSKGINMQELIGKDENTYKKEGEKISTELTKNIEENGKKTGADSEVIEWKKSELKASILGFLGQYEMYHGQMTGNPTFKTSKTYKDYVTSLQKDNDKMVETLPVYRNYLLNSIGQDFQKYSATKNQTPAVSTSEMFSTYLTTRKDLSQITKDYLLAYVMAQTDINPKTTKETKAKIAKIIDTEIKDPTVKSDLKKIDFVVSGFPEGTVLQEANLIKADGKSFSTSETKGKPTMYMYYASWNPYIAQSTIPILKEVVNFYKAKMNFVFVNLDDNKEQFTKTSAAMLKGIAGTNVYAEGGLNSDLAKNYGIFGFKLPSFIVVDKDGKTVGSYFVNLGDQNLVSTLDKLTGLKAPAVAPQAQLQNDLLNPQMQAAPQQNTAPATK